MQRFPLSSSYAAAIPSEWSSFPSLPIIRGPRSYKADTHAQCSDSDACRIASYSHSTLTPGIFTIYCPLGIAVKLHIELYLFQDTQFFVHWKRHVGSSRGYCLNAYNFQSLHSSSSSFGWFRVFGL